MAVARCSHQLRNRLLRAGDGVARGGEAAVLAAVDHLVLAGSPALGLDPDEQGLIAGRAARPARSRTLLEGHGGPTGGPAPRTGHQAATAAGSRGSDPTSHSTSKPANPFRNLRVSNACEGARPPEAGIPPWEAITAPRAAAAAVNP